MKKLLIAILIVAGLASCDTNNENNDQLFKINMNLENSSNKTVYLGRYDHEEMIILDSVVAKHNKATFKVNKSDNLDALLIMMNGWRRPLTFFADNQDVTITGDYQNYNGISVVASESQNKINELTEAVNEMEDDNEIRCFVMDFIKQNSDKPIGVYALYRYKWAFSLEDLQKLYEIIPQDMQSEYKLEVMKYIDGLEMTSVGESFIGFKQNDVNGYPVSFADIIKISKVVILDFWASWCPDCRKANPGLVALYDEFNDKGLKIVSVSLDTNEEAWKQAIEKDDLKWRHHLSDLKGWDNSVAKSYTISYIPQTIVFDENGIIIGKNLPEEELRELLKTVLE